MQILAELYADILVWFPCCSTLAEIVSLCFNLAKAKQNLNQLWPRNPGRSSSFRSGCLQPVKYGGERSKSACNWLFWRWKIENIEKGMQKLQNMIARVQLCSKFIKTQGLFCGCKSWIKEKPCAKRHQKDGGWTKKIIRIIRGISRCLRLFGHSCRLADLQLSVDHGQVTLFVRYLATAPQKSETWDTGTFNTLNVIEHRWTSLNNWSLPIRFYQRLCKRLQK
jgi:hypothetical protein